MEIDDQINYKWFWEEPGSLDALVLVITFWEFRGRIPEDDAFLNNTDQFIFTLGLDYYNIDTTTNEDIINKYSFNKESDKSKRILFDNKTKGYLNTNNDNLELQLSINSKEIS